MAQHNLLLLTPSDICSAFEDFKCHLTLHKPELMMILTSAPDDVDLIIPTNWKWIPTHGNEDFLHFVLVYESRHDVSCTDNRDESVDELVRGIDDLHGASDSLADIDQTDHKPYESGIDDPFPELRCFELYEPS